MSLSNYAELMLLEYLLNSGAVTMTRPSAWYMALHTADPAETGANEVSTGDYARVSTTFDTVATAGDGTTRNAGAVSFGLTSGGPATCTHISIWDAVSGGNCLMEGPLNESRVLSTTQNITLAIADIIAALT